MCPLGVGSSYSTDTLTTGEAKLWILLVGINKYQDPGLPSLRYPALDCQGLGEALSTATQGFPNKEVIIHNDFTAQPPTLEIIRSSLLRIVSQTQTQDSILLYFSGHGMLEPNHQEAVLCLADTRTDDLLTTGLPMQELLQMLGTTSANQQLVCLDTCHSGGMKLIGGNGGSARDGNSSFSLLNPAPQMTQLLRQRASQSKGFCALLSCDQEQQSWEFPELGHGLFTYYLMQGLLGAAADAHGVIEADGLYKYVYRQTLQYIDKLNHQLRLINQQKLSRGESKLYPEYPLQTPKRIVEGVGELIVGYKRTKAESDKHRRALVLDGLANQKTTTDLSRLLAGAGGFELKYVNHQGKSLLEIRGAIQEFLRGSSESAGGTLSSNELIKNIPISLLYLRGHIEEIEDGEAWLVLGDDIHLSRSWLRQELRRAGKTQQIIILDCPEASSLENWIEDLQSGTEHGQCIIAAASTVEEPELFSQTLLETLVAANPQAGLAVAKWITQLQPLLLARGVNLDVWLSGTQIVIDILPGNISKVFQDLQELKLPDIEKNQQQQNQSFTSANKIANRPIQVVPKQESTAGSAEVAALSTNQIEPQLKLTLDSEQYANLEKLLKKSIGSIAPTVLQKALNKASNLEKLVEKLATYLLPEQRQSFEQQAMAILQKINISSSTNTDDTPIIDANLISQCERELAYTVGPIARLITQQVLKSHPQISLPEFVKKLATKITEPQQALEFERRLLGK